MGTGFGSIEMVEGSSAGGGIGVAGGSSGVLVGGMEESSVVKFS